MNKISEKDIVEYMKNTLKTFNKLSYHIINFFKYNLNNGINEGVNTLIKRIKKIALTIVASITLKLKLCLLLVFINIIKEKSNISI